jgi:hypothetical protein
MRGGVKVCSNRKSLTSWTIRVLIPSLIASLSSRSFTGIETFYQKKRLLARGNGQLSSYVMSVGKEGAASAPGLTGL